MDSLGGDRSIPAIEHDALMLALIEETCPDMYSFLERPMWLLTEDRKLVNFISRRVTRKSHVSVLYPSQLLELLKFTTPSNNDFDEAFLGLFVHSYVGGEMEVKAATLHQLMSRMSMYQGLTPSIVTRMLSDRLLVMRFEDCTTDEQKDELVGEALITRAAQTEEELEAARKRVTEIGVEKERTEMELVRVTEMHRESADMNVKSQQERSVLERKLRTLGTLGLAITCFIALYTIPRVDLWLKIGVSVITVACIRYFLYLILEKQQAKKLEAAVLFSATLAQFFYGVFTQ